MLPRCPNCPNRLGCFPRCERPALTVTADRSVPVEILPGGIVQEIRPGQQTCGCTAVHYPCPFNLYR